jgi:hypothetical protein
MKMTKITLKLSEIRTDPLQYKPYAPLYTSDGLYVEVEVPAAYVTENTENGSQVLSPEGYKYLLILLANLVSEAHDERLKEMMV